jgi:DNA-directed RNA polymerase subunit RPC12/RpoP
MLGSGIQIRVLEEDLEKALALIGTKEDNTICPHCGSENIKLTLSKSWKRTLFVILSFISFIPMGNLLDKYKCLDCNNVFNS